MKIRFPKDILSITCYALITLTLLSGLCVFVHDADQASNLASEHPLLVLGHSQGVMIEDAVVILLLLVVALMPKFTSRTKLTRVVRISLLTLCSVIMFVEFGSEIAIVMTENQLLLSNLGKLTRVLAVLLSAGTGLGCITTATVLFSNGETEATNP